MLLDLIADQSAAGAGHPSAELSYAHGTGAVPLLGETIGANLRRTVERFGDREALVVRHQQVRLTYRELWDLSTRCARGLIAQGVKHGDRVGIWAPNRYEWVIVQFAAARIGAILVNINPAYKTAELEYALRQSGVSLLLLAQGFRQSNYVAMLAEVRDRCPDLGIALVFEDDWDLLLDSADEVSETQLATRGAAVEFDDPVNIQYTSGTTGSPKGATLSHHNILNNAFVGTELISLTEQDRVCVPVPFYHCFGCVLAVLGTSTHGACLVVPSETFEPLAVLEAIEAERCTALYGVPTMFIMELEHPRFAEFDLSSLRTGMMGGAPCPVEVMKKVQSAMYMRDVTIVCGMTETAPLSTQTVVGDPLDKQVGTVGRVHPHVEVKIVDPNTGRTVPRGTPGEQCTRGYNVMLGYWNNVEATRNAIDPARWMHTGDLAEMDDQGYVKIVGRIKDMLIRGGENIFPREIEDFLYTHPAVSDVQVIGVPDEKYGEEVMAWVKLRAGAVASADELKAFCKGQIATFKIPRYWKFVDDFPMTVTGKIQKFRMREIAIEELGLSLTTVITHPEKVLFPDDGITKGELAAYYAAIAPSMLPHIQARPVTMERYPTGIGQKGFLQKDVSKGFPEWLARSEVPKKGGVVHYPLVGDARSLEWLANQNCITPHVWTSRLPELYQPDLCVFDLDPTEDEQIEVLRAAALAVRDLLAELDLPSWVKTSGSKGFHIVVPLDGTSDFDEVAHFAGAVGAVLVKRDPAHLTQEFNKIDRGGRIYVDTGRNGYGATFAATYAVRARAGAPVSAPCTWQEVERGQVSPQTFTLRTMSSRMDDVGELWLGLYAHARALRGPLEQLRGLQV